MRSEIWNGVDQLIDRAESLEDSHRTASMLAARRWRDLGRDVPAPLQIEELAAMHKGLSVKPVMQRIRDAYDGELAVLKGPDVATLYPATGLRPSADLDVLAQDAERAQRACVAAGFEPVGFNDDEYFEGLHHLRPLRLPGHHDLVVEIHRRPNWVDWADPPTAGEILDSAVRSSIGIDGVLGVHPAHHAVLVAAHSWGERPLRRVSDLLDAALLAETSGRGNAEKVAARWNLDRLWRTTLQVADSLFYDGPLSMGGEDFRPGSSSRSKPYGS